MGESGGVPQGHGGDNFLLTKSGLRKRPRERSWASYKPIGPFWVKELEPNFHPWLQALRLPACLRDSHLHSMLLHAIDWA